MLLNYTPYPITIVAEDGSVLYELPSVGCVRIQVTETEVGTRHGIPVYKSVFGKVEGLPPHKDGVFYIVSALVRTALPDRTDLYSPAGHVRNEAGMIIGCRGLVMN